MTEQYGRKRDYNNYFPINIFMIPPIYGSIDNIILIYFNSENVISLYLCLTIQLWLGLKYI